MNEYYRIEDKIARTSNIVEKGDIEETLCDMYDVSFLGYFMNDARETAVVDAIGNIVDCINGRSDDMWGCDYLNITVERYYPHEDMPLGRVAYTARIGGCVEEWECGTVPNVWVADVVDCFNANAHIRHEFASEKARDNYIKSYGYEPVDYDEYDTQIWATVVGTDIVAPVPAHYDVVYGV